MCGNSDAYILDKEIRAIPNIHAADADANNDNKKVISKTFSPFINSITEINNTRIDNAKDIDIVVLMHY